MDSFINIDTAYLISNGSILNEVRFYKRIWFSYFHPVTVFTGLISNLFVLLVLPKLKYALSDKSRFQYQCLATFDFMTLLTFHFLQVFLGDSMFFASTGQYYIYIDKMGSWPCKLSWFNWYLFMALANYCYVEFCIERAIGVCFPLRAKSLLRGKLRLFLWLIIVIFPSMFIALFALYVKEKISNSRAIGGVTCDIPSTHHLLWEYCVAACLLIYLVHVTATIALNIVILRSLHKASTDRWKLAQRNASGRSSCKAKEANATLTLVVLSGIQVFIYFPAGLSCAGYCFLRFQPLEIRLQFYDEFVELNNALGLFNAMTSISHSINFFVYFFRIPVFRKEILKIFCLSQNLTPALPSSISTSRVLSN